MITFFFKYMLLFFKATDQGSLETYPDPDPPTDLGTAMTQGDIDFVKKLRNEIENRFGPI